MNEINKEVIFLTTQLNQRPVDSATNPVYVDSITDRIKKVIAKLNEMPGVETSNKDQLLVQLQDTITKNNVRLQEKYNNCLTIISNARQNLAVAPTLAPQAPSAPPRPPRGYNEKLKAKEIDTAKLDSLKTIDYVDVYTLREKNLQFVPDDQPGPPSCHTKPALKNTKSDPLENEILDYLESHPNKDDPLRKIMAGYIGTNRNEMKKIFESACVSWAVAACEGTPVNSKNPDWYVRHSEYFSLFNQDNLQDLKNWPILIKDCISAIETFKQKPEILKTILTNWTLPLTQRDNDKDIEFAMKLSKVQDELDAKPPKMDSALSLLADIIQDITEQQSQDTKTKFIQDILNNVSPNLESKYDYVFKKYGSMITNILFEAISKTSPEEYQQVFDRHVTNIDKLEFLFQNPFCGLKNNEKDRIRKYGNEINNLLTRSNQAQKQNFKELNQEVVKLYLQTLGYEIVPEDTTPYKICMTAKLEEISAQDHWGVQVSTDSKDHIFETLDFKPIGHKPHDWKTEWGPKGKVLVTVPVKELTPRHYEIIKNVISHGTG